MEILKLLIKIKNCGVGGGGVVVVVVLSISLASISLMMFLFSTSIHYILPKTWEGKLQHHTYTSAIQFLMCSFQEIVRCSKKCDVTSLPRICNIKEAG